MSDNLQRKTAFPLFLDSFEGATAERYYQCTTAFWIFDVPGCCASPSCSIVLVILVLVLSHLSIGRNMQDILLGIALSTWTILPVRKTLKHSMMYIY